MREGGRVERALDQTPWLRELPRHGYAVAVVEARGSGASTGAQDGPFAPDEQGDGRAVTEWLATRSWSNGRIGMFGSSYGETYQSGHSRYLAEGFQRLDAPGVEWYEAGPEGRLARITLDLTPTAFAFAEGSRIRLSITGADEDGVSALVKTPSPTLDVFSTREHPSSLTLWTRPALGGLSRHPDTSLD